MLFSCNQADNSGRIITDSGYEVEIHKKAEGKQIQRGEYVYFNVDILNDKEELIQSLRNAPELPVVQTAC